MARLFVLVLLGIGTLTALSGLCLITFTSKDQTGNLLFSGLVVIAVTWFFAAMAGMCDHDKGKPAETKEKKS